MDPITNRVQTEPAYFPLEEDELLYELEKSFMEKAWTGADGSQHPLLSSPSSSLGSDNEALPEGDLLRKERSEELVDRVWRYVSGENKFCNPYQELGTDDSEANPSEYGPYPEDEVSFCGERKAPFVIEYQKGIEVRRYPIEKYLEELSKKPIG